MCTDGPLAIAEHLASAGRVELGLEYARATQKRLDSLRTKFTTDRAQALEELAALNEKAKKNGNKRKPADFSRSLALTRQLAVLRAAAKDLEQALGRCKQILEGLHRKQGDK